MINVSTLKKPVNIYLGDNRPVKATKVGIVIIYFEVFRKQNKININKIFYAKEMSANLISLGKLTDNKNTVISKGNIAKVMDEDDKLTAVTFKENGTYSDEQKCKHTPLILRKRRYHD